MLPSDGVTSFSLVWIGWVGLFASFDSFDEWGSPEAKADPIPWQRTEG